MTCTTEAVAENAANAAAKSTPVGNAKSTPVGNAESTPNRTEDGAANTAAVGVAGDGAFGDGAAGDGAGTAAYKEQATVDFMHGAADGAPPAVALVGSDETVLVWGTGCRRVLGYHAEDVIGGPARRLLAHPDRPVRWSSAPGAIGRRGARNTAHAVVDLRHRDGGVRRLAVEVVGLTGTGGEESWVVAVTGEAADREAADSEAAHTEAAHGDHAEAARGDHAEAAGGEVADGKAAHTVAADGGQEVPGAGRRGAGGAKAGEREVVQGDAALLRLSPWAMTVWDTDLRLLWANEACRRTAGFMDSRASAPSPSPSARMVLRGFDRSVSEPVMRQALVSGEPVPDHVVRWVSTEDGREAVFSVSLVPFASGEGTPAGLVSIAVDITQGWERDRLALLGRAAHRIGTTLDVKTTAQELAGTAVPVLADYVAVDLAEAVPLGGEPLERMPKGEFGIPVFRRAGMASGHEGAP